MPSFSPASCWDGVELETEAADRSGVDRPVPSGSKIGTSGLHLNREWRERGVNVGAGPDRATAQCGSGLEVGRAT